jgi:hypothetical protein
MHINLSVDLIAFKNEHYDRQAQRGIPPNLTGNFPVIVFRKTPCVFVANLLNIWILISPNQNSVLWQKNVFSNFISKATSF